MEDNLIKLERWKGYTRKIPYGKVGFGYMVDPEDPYNIIPDVEQIKFLEQGFDYLDAGSSLREVAEWVSQKLLKPMVHQTMSNLYKNHRKPFLRVKTAKKAGVKKTKEELRVAAAKANAKRAQTKAKTLEEKYREKKLKREDYDNPPEEKKRPNNFIKDETKSHLPPVPKEVNFVFTPNPGPQTSFLSASEEEVLYGGSAGGDPKSWIFASFSK